jgi:molybdenum cofactor cytidylyltransferase
VAGELADLSCETVLNPDFDGPTSSSLHLALEQLPGDVEAVIILLGDMVFTTPEMVRTLSAAAESSEAAIVASRYGEVHAPPLLFRRALFRELLAWTGEGCGKAVVRRHIDEVLFLERVEEALADVDTPEDYARARERIEGLRAGESKRIRRS